MAAIRVLIADGSTPRRQRLVALLGADPEIMVAGAASAGVEIIELTEKLRPDILVMDLALSTPEGADVTREIMADCPTPILILAGENQAQGHASMASLASGALAVVAHPNEGDEVRFVSMVKAMAQVKVVRRWRDRARAPEFQLRGPARKGSSARIVAIAASTGGPAALLQVLNGLPPDFPLPILIVQHIGVGFTAGMVDWLNATSPLTVKLAAHRETLKPRTVYVAPDDRHLGVADMTTILLSDAPPIGGFRPSGNFLFESVANAFGPRAVHVILTGMGQDGVAGLKIAQTLGGTIIAQDPKTAVVSSMPGEAINAGVVDYVTPLPVLARDLSAIARMSGGSA